MDDEKVWLHHPVTGGYFHCPADAVDAWRDLGWQVAEQPPDEPPSPVVAEHLAWREQQDWAAAAVADKTDSKPTKAAARRGAENGVNDG